MAIALNAESCVVFDLDDTLYKEIEFVRSGLRAAARRLCAERSEAHFGRLWELYEQEPQRVFDVMLAEIEDAPCSVDDLITEYRTHVPSLELPEPSRAALERLRAAGCILGLITDGRSVTQRNKLSALGIADLFDEVVISEEFGSTKPDPRNYLHFTERFPGREMVYIGDNPKKDFVAPRKLGWRTYCVRDDGCHVHSQRCELPPEHLPHEMIGDLGEIEVAVR